MVDGTHDNSNPQVEGMLDRTDVTGESGEGEGGLQSSPTGFRAERVQFDISLTRGFNNPFAHVTKWERQDGCLVITTWSWDRSEIVSEFETQPGGELQDFFDIIESLIAD